MANYKITGKRFLRKYTASSRTQTYSALSDAEMVSAKLGTVPWEESPVDQSVFPAHSGKSESSDAENVKDRDKYDAALFCADHSDGRHRAYANAACYRLSFPDSAQGVNLTEIAVKIYSDPYNSLGARVAVFASDSDTPPMDCFTCRTGSSSDTSAEAQTNNGTETAPATEWYSTNTHVEGVSPRQERDNSWFPAQGTAIIRPAGGLALKKYLYVFVLLENYAVARNGFLEGSSYATPTFDLTTDAEIDGWDGDSEDVMGGKKKIGIYWKGENNNLPLTYAELAEFDDVYGIKTFVYQASSSGGADITVGATTNKHAAVALVRKKNGFYVALFDPYGAAKGRPSVSLMLICRIDGTDSFSVAAMNSAIKEGTIKACFFFPSSNQYRPISFEPGESGLFYCRIVVPGLAPEDRFTKINCIKPEGDISHVSLTKGTDKPPEMKRAFNVDSKDYSWYSNGNWTVALTDSKMLVTKESRVWTTYGLKYISVAGSVKHIFEFPISSKDPTESIEGENLLYKYVAVGDFSSIDGVEVHNFANLVPNKYAGDLPGFIINPLFPIQISLDTYDELSICPVYHSTSSIFAPVVSKYLLRGKFKKVNDIDVDGCVCIDIENKLITPMLDIIPDGLLFPSVGSVPKQSPGELLDWVAVFVLS